MDLVQPGASQGVVRGVNNNNNNVVPARPVAVAAVAAAAADDWACAVHSLSSTNPFSALVKSLVITATVVGSFNHMEDIIRTREKNKLLAVLALCVGAIVIVVVCALFTIAFIIVLAAVGYSWRGQLVLQ